MELRELRTFLRVADDGSVSRAAAQLHLTQPALSRHIRNLESELGVDLFVRTGRGLVLSEAGIRLERRVRHLVAAIDETGAELQRDTQQVTGEVAVGVPPSVGVGLVGLIESYRSRFPRVRLRVVVALSGVVRAGLLGGSLDLGVLYRPLRTAALEATPLWNETLWWIGPPGELTPDEPMSFAAVAARPLVLPGVQHGLRRVVEDYAARGDLELDVPVEIDALRLLLALVGRGQGYTLLPRSAVRDVLEAGLVSAAPVYRPELRRVAVLAWSKGRPRSNAALAMAALLSEQLGAELDG
ncbi:MAG: LysR family transcriptional regulator [Myxococcales bacterium FL481]|nr:MAG: LysR family transcriptional regulator [Myxococcales bacterium FL481]